MEQPLALAHPASRHTCVTGALAAARPQDARAELSGPTAQVMRRVERRRAAAPLAIADSQGCRVRSSSPSDGARMLAQNPVACRQLCPLATRSTPCGGQFSHVKQRCICGIVCSTLELRTATDARHDRFWSFLSTHFRAKARTPPTLGGLSHRGRTSSARSGRGRLPSAGRGRRAGGRDRPIPDA